MSDQRMSDRLALLDDPQVRPFLPMLYVAWADDGLTGKERARIRDRIVQEPWLRPRARQTIEAFLDADHAPSATELARVRKTIAEMAGNLPLDERRSLASYASELAEEDEAKNGSHAAAEELGTLLSVDEVEPWVANVPRVEDAWEASLDVDALLRARDGAHTALRSEVRAFLDDPARRAYGLPTDEYRALVRGWLADVAARFGTLAFPTITSDAQDLRPFMVVFESLAHGDLSLVVKAGVQLGLFGGSLYFLGSARHRRLLPDVAALRMQGCFAMSEVGHGSNVADIETIARYDHATRTLEIHTPREAARKDWIGGAANDAAWATVFAQLEVAGERHGVHAVLVPIRDANGAPTPGVRIGDCGLKMGLNGVDNGRLWFDSVRVPASSLLDRFGRIDENGVYESKIASPGKRFFTMLGTLVGGRICVGSAAVSVSESALAIAVRYATTRRQFGAPGERELPLLAYPTHKRRLLPNLATTYVLRFAFERLRDHFAEVHAKEGADTRELEAEAAGLKAMATWHATATVQQCREACGGQGYLAVNRLPDLRADSDVFSTFEGDNTVLLGLVARSVVTRFGKRLEDGGIGALIRMVGSVAATALRDKNPVARGETSSEHILSRDFHLAALTYREETLVRTAARRMQKRLAKKMDPQAAALELQAHFVAAARAYVERLAFTSFRASVEALEEGETRTWLEKLGALHALSRIETDLAFYLEEGYVDGGKARAIRKAVVSLEDEIAPVARDLVAAFGIPEACLAAPIAFFDPAFPNVRAQPKR